MTIKTDNAAFEAPNTKPELARILKQLSEQLEQGTAGEAGKLRDINGNCVGAWTLTN